MGTDYADQTVVIAFLSVPIRAHPWLKIFSSFGCGQAKRGRAVKICAICGCLPLLSSSLRLRVSAVNKDLRLLFGQQHFDGGAGFGETVEVFEADFSFGVDHV